MGDGFAWVPFWSNLKRRVYIYIINIHVHGTISWLPPKEFNPASLGGKTQPSGPKLAFGNPKVEPCT